MYNLIVTADCEGWESGRYGLDISRLGEYTPEPLKVRYRKLDDSAMSELLSFPTLFAYETPCEAPARVGRVTRFRQSSGSQVRFEFTLRDDIRPIAPSVIETLAWDLDINDWELNRTHWAIKDVDLLRVLSESIPIPEDAAPQSSTVSLSPVDITPTVFSVPAEPRESDLVALMMPFDPTNRPVLAAVREACGRAGFRCVRADDIWEDSTIIQDIFSLIYRSTLVIADLTNLNGNVLYETGIAHTLGRPVIPISQGSVRLPFDLAHHRALFFDSSDEGLGEMARRLERRLRHLAT